MRRLDIDFRHSNRSTNWLGLALLALGLAGAIMSATQYQQLDEELAQTEASLRQADSAARKQASKKTTGTELAQLAPEIKRAREAAQAIKLPWPELFASVEAARMPDVALLAIVSDNTKREIKITGQARNPQSMLEYFSRIEAQPGLANSHLLSHHLELQDPQHPVRFVLAANWSPVGLTRAAGAP
jgi:Tfp pilus assembly protein PilN